MGIAIPETLKLSVGKQPNGDEWLANLPRLVSELIDRWQLTLDAPFSDELTGSWVAPGMSPHGHCVLKVGFPHFEADFEIEGMQILAGTCAVQLFDFDKSSNALLLERGLPGASLRQEPDLTQDQVICELLREIWQATPDPSIRSLQDMIEIWCASTRQRFQNETQSRDMIFKGLATLADLANDNVPTALLVTDLHAGNVVSAERRPWLMIDPKPHIGDPCYDLTQHLLNIKPRLAVQGMGLVERLSRAAQVDAKRVMQWTVGRLCLDRENHKLAHQLTRYL